MHGTVIEQARLAGLDVQCLEGATGVRIGGVHASRMTDAQLSLVQRLVSEFCVALLPDQGLGPAEQAAFLARFAPLVSTPGAASLPGHPDVMVVADAADPARPVSGPLHSDTSFVERPPSYTSLSAIEVPAHGGGTLFANQYAAWDALSPALRGWLQGLRVQHFEARRARELPAPVWHPLARRHPLTGRTALYLTNLSRLHAVEGLAASEGRMLIDFLYRHSHGLHAQYRHRWQRGDVVIWDNRCSMHAAIHDHGGQPRRLYRVMCAGEVPIAATARAA
jgi:taurine dioxygenase